MRKSVVLTIIVTLFCVSMFGQVITVSTNPKIMSPTTTGYLIGGKLVMVFDQEMPIYVPTTIALQLDRPATFFYCGDQSRPLAYRDGNPRLELTSSCSHDQVLIKIDNRAYQGAIKNLTIENFVLDIFYDSTLQQGDSIEMLLFSSDDRITFMNPQVRLMRVGAQLNAGRPQP